MNQSQRHKKKEALVLHLKNSQAKEVAFSNIHELSIIVRVFLIVIRDETL